MQVMQSTGLTGSMEKRQDTGRSALHDARPASEAAVSARGLTKAYRHPWTLKITPGLTDVTFEVHCG